MTKLYREEKTLTEQEVQQAARYWQNRLSLNDWIIQAYIERKEDLPEETEAMINYNLNKKHARISVLHPEQAHGDEPHDMEALIVHELLHLHFAPLGHEESEDDRHPLETVALEQAVEAITRAIIVSERDKVVRFNSGKDDQIRQLAEDRDRYREKTIRLQEKLDDLQRKYDQQNKDMEYISGNRLETDKENRRLRQVVEELRSRVSDQDEDLDYYRGAEDARRRHSGPDRHVPDMPTAEEGALDVSTHVIKVPAAFTSVARDLPTAYRTEGQKQRDAERIGFGNLRKELTAAFSVPNSATITAASIQDAGIYSDQLAGLDDEPTLYEEPDDGTGAE